MIRTDGNRPATRPVFLLAGESAIVQKQNRKPLLTDTTMQTLTCIIVDDVQNNRNFLQSVLQRNFPEIDVLEMVGSIGEAIRSIGEWQPDIIFLDIELADGLGFEVLSGQENVYTIVTSAYKEYAFDAFRHNVIDYLVKPLDIARLHKAIEKVKERVATDRTHDISVKPEAASAQGKMIAVSNRSGVEFIRAENILSLEADGKYTLVETRDGKSVLSSKNLKEIEAILPEIFVRVHHSYIVNLLSCRSFLKDTHMIVLENGKEIPVSVRKRDSFLQLFNKI